MRDSYIQDYKGGKIVRTFRGMYRFVDNDYTSEEHNTIGELVERAEDGRTTLAKEVDSGEENNYVEPDAEQKSRRRATQSADGSATVLEGNEEQPTVVEEATKEAPKRAGRKK